MTRFSANNPAGPGNPPSPFVWKENTGLQAGGLETGPFTLDPGSVMTLPDFPADVYGQIESSAQDRTITVQAYAYSVAKGVSVTVNLNPYIMDIAPTATPAVPSPTPVAAMGKVVTAPQPAKDQMCFIYTAPAGGAFVAVVYNAAFQTVATIKDSAVGNVSGETTCIDVSGFANGVYYYKLKVGDHSFGLNSFGIVH